MYIVNEEDKEYRFGDSGPKYLMKGPRMNFALVAARKEPLPHLASTSR